MRLTRRVLFGLLGVTVLVVVALIITSNVTRGPAHSFELVSQTSSTEAQLRSDAGTLVTRLENLGYRTQAQVANGSIEVTMYGSGPQLRSALMSSLAQGRLYMRPVECAAPGYRAPAGPAPVALKCESRYLLSAEALKVDPRTGSARVTIPPQPGLAAVPSASASAEPAGSPVIVPAGRGSGFMGQRLVLGPASVDNSDVESAQATSSNGSGWIIDLTFNSSGSNAFDLLSEDQFHAYIGVEVDATAISVPLTEPNQTTYVSLGSTSEIVADFTRTQAVSLANAITAPLAVPLRLSATAGT